MASVEAETWEKLQDLSLKDSEQPASTSDDSIPTAEPTAVVATQSVSGSDGRSLVNPPDSPILHALKDQKERATVLQIEQMVEKFITDTSREVLEFPQSYTNYQRMLAHKVAQYYGLQTSTVDYEGGVGRVVAQRTKDTQQNVLKLASLDVNSLAANEGSPKGDKGGPKLLRRPNGHDPRSGADAVRNQNSARSAKEREEEYSRARERIIGTAAPDGQGRGGRGFGGRGPSMPSAPGNGGRGRGRKAAFRDRAMDDPDYKRGLNRYTNAAFDPNYAQAPQGGMYNVPTYSSEFPALNRAASGNGGANSKPGYRDNYQQSWGSSQQYRPPPPPPPPSPPVQGQQGAKGNYGAQHGASPAGSSAAQQMAAMRPYAAMPMGHYPMPAIGMAYGPGVAGHAAMYGGAAYPYAIAPGAYGFMAPPGQDGVMSPTAPYPMYGYPAAPMYPAAAMAHMPHGRGMAVYGAPMQGYAADGSMAGQYGDKGYQQHYGQHYAQQYAAYQQQHYKGYQQPSTSSGQHDSERADAE